MTRITDATTNTDSLTSAGHFYTNRTDLAHAVEAGDPDKLEEAIAFLPVDWSAYIIDLRRRADAAGRTELHDYEKFRAVITASLMASPQPGKTVDADIAREAFEAMLVVHQLRTETPEQRAIRKACAEADYLVDLYGTEDLRTLAAIIKAAELQDPGCCRRKAIELRLFPPNPTYCDAEGVPLYSLEEVAQALDADPDDLREQVEILEAAGVKVRRQPAGRAQ